MWGGGVPRGVLRSEQSEVRAFGLPCSSKAAGFKRTQSSQEIRDPSFVLAANFLPAVGERAFYSAEKWEAETNRFILGSATLPLNNGG